MAQPTKGPWKHVGHHVEVEGEEGNWICVLDTCFKTREEVDANARLIVEAHNQFIAQKENRYAKERL